MNKEQTEAIIGLLGGMQTAIVHLSNIICIRTEAAPEDLAKSFEETAEAIPAEVRNRELMQLSLRQVAAGIRNSGAGAEWERLVSRLLH